MCVRVAAFAGASAAGEHAGGRAGPPVLRVGEHILCLRPGSGWPSSLEVRGGCPSSCDILLFFFFIFYFKLLFVSSVRLRVPSSTCIIP